MKNPYGNILGTGLRKVINSLVSAVKNVHGKNFGQRKLISRNSKSQGGFSRKDCFWNWGNCHLAPKGATKSWWFLRKCNAGRGQQEVRGTVK